MKRMGLEKARARLKDAFRAFEELKQANDWEGFESAWARLLTALNATYAILGQSSKGTAKSEGWFSRVLGQRKADELLSYLWHARNSNDHGIESVIKLEPGGIGIGGRKKAVFIEKLIVGPGGNIEELRGWEGQGEPLTITRYPSRVHLVPVTDRGVTYDPPKTFLGNPIKDSSPTAVAQEALEFMVILFGEAEGLVVQTTGT
ncbi:MAG TPA: hypothetical protein VM308_03255 [Sphingomicrobium sp.]|nr:hypothetical protein [Sphingomicrobium sp.]